MTENDPVKLNVDVVSDIVCPWCYVGKRQLDKAIDLLPDVKLDIRWRPYQLNPQMPEVGMDRADYMESKFGKGASEGFYRKLETVGEELDINFDFQSIRFAPNTLDAHRLIHWASYEKKGKSDKKTTNQSDMVARLFEVYFEQGGNLGEKEVLVDAAKSLGMDGQLVSDLLDGNRDIKAVEDQVAIAGKMGISGVPCFIIENKYAVMGAQSPEVLAENFKKAYEEKLDDQKSDTK
ncbi:MAG: DsbA family oxidoreductase [Hyphomicrobiales bacterium]|nr:DsbA family oxidoreductase [Hyphomicrobiales bacterium]